MDIDESVTLEADDVIKIELFNNMPFNIVQVRPTATYHHIGIDSKPFVLYEETTPPVDVQGIDTTYSKTYVRIDDISTVGTHVESVSGNYIAFDPIAYGRIFIVAHTVGVTNKVWNVDSLLEINTPLVFELEQTINDIKFEEPFVLDTHTGKSESTGDLYDPNDPDAEIDQPAWHLMDGDETYDPTGRWVFTLRPGGVSAIYDLAPAHQGSQYILGFRIGALPNLDDYAASLLLPINYQLHVDGVLAKSIINDKWYKGSGSIHTHMLAVPILVNSQIELFIPGVQAEGVFTLAIDLWEPIFSDTLETLTVPLLGDIECIPHLNGKELVRDIDYHLVDVQDPSVGEGIPHLSGKQLVITNASYLEEENNTVRSVVTHDSVIGELQGYLTRSLLDQESSSALWFDELSTVCVDGYNTDNIAEHYGNVAVAFDPGFRAGAPYGVRTYIPYLSKQFIDRFADNDDTATIVQLTEYFRQFATEEEPITIIPYSHRIVSIRMHNIVRDMLNGDIVIPVDPDPENTLEMLADYDYLKQYDIAFDATSNIDFDFVDVQAMYTDQIISDPVLFAQVQHVISVLLQDSVEHLRPDQE